MLYNNSNGRKYEVVELNNISQVAILKPLTPTFDKYPFMVAKGFRIDATSWDNGIYDLTLAVAQEIYNDYR